MTDRPDDYETGLVLCLHQHRRLSGLDSNHELLRYGSIKDGKFEYDSVLLIDAANRFAPNGDIPKSDFSWAYMFAKYSTALKDAADKIEEARTE